MNTEERNEKIELYGRGYDLLMATLENVPEDAMHFKPEPKEWSVHEVIIHLADSESIAAQQARMMVAEPGRAVMAYDPDAWADNLHYQDADKEEALKLLQFTREWLIQLRQKRNSLKSLN